MVYYFCNYICIVCPLVWDDPRCPMSNPYWAQGPQKEDDEK